MGPTKQGEYSRSAELFTELCNTQGIYFALFLLADSGYNNKDIQEILKYIKPDKIKP